MVPRGIGDESIGSAYEARQEVKEEIQAENQGDPEIPETSTEGSKRVGLTRLASGEIKPGVLSAIGKCIARDGDIICTQQYGPAMMKCVTGEEGAYSEAIYLKDSSPMFAFLGMNSRDGYFNVSANAGDPNKIPDDYDYSLSLQDAEYSDDIASTICEDVQRQIRGAIEIDDDDLCAGLTAIQCAIDYQPNRFGYDFKKMAEALTQVLEEQGFEYEPIDSIGVEVKLQNGQKVKIYPEVGYRASGDMTDFEEAFEYSMQSSNYGGYSYPKIDSVVEQLDEWESGTEEDEEEYIDPPNQ